MVLMRSRDWLIGLGIAVVAVGGGFLFGKTAQAAPSNPPPPPPPSNTNVLQPGGSYTLTLTCPSPMIPLPAQVTNAWAAGLFTGIPISVTSVSTGGVALMGGAAMATSLTVNFTYTGTSPVPLPPIQAGGATPCSTTLQGG
jgi:hypothetical protein